MKHLTLGQRYEISSLVKQGKSDREIAASLGRHRTTAWREKKRNKNKATGVYEPDLAQRKADQRKKEKRKYKRFTQKMADDIANLLILKKFSPSQISRRLQLEGAPNVSPERIYQHIWEDKKKGGVLYQSLRRNGRRNAKRGSKTKSRGQIAGRVGIEHRPKTVDEKKEAGDLEIDTVIGKDHKSAVVTINDRVTGYLWAIKLAGKDSADLAQAVIKALLPYKGRIRTITADNGKEFAGHELIAKALGICFYFANPYHSWERGANENLNGLLRQYFPKKTDFNLITEQQLADAVKELNMRPRKRLGYLNPIEYYQKLTTGTVTLFKFAA